MKSLTLSDAMLKTVFHGDDFTLLDSVSTFYLSLHTSSPGQSGDQSTNEVSYTPYARLPVSRSGTEFISTSGKMTLAEDQGFAEVTAGSGVASYVGIGLAETGTGTLLYYGPFSPTVTINPGTTPTVGAGTVISES